MHLVSSKEFSIIANVSRQAIAKQINSGKLRNAADGRNVKIDLHDNLAVEYLKQQEFKKVNKTEKENLKIENSETDNQQEKEKGKRLQKSKEELEKIKVKTLDEIRSKNDYSKLKDKVSIDKMNLEMDKQLGNLISRSLIDKKFGQMSNILLNYLFPMGDRLAGIVAGIFESTDNEKILKTKKLIDDETMKAITEFKKACTSEDIIEDN